MHVSSSYLTDSIRVDLENHTLSAAASDFKMFAATPTLRLKSGSGMEVDFTLCETRFDNDNDIRYWEYTPVLPELSKWSLRVWND